MNGFVANPDELQKLLIGLIDRDLTPVQRDRLGEVLQDDPAARQCYLFHMAIHGRLCKKHLAPLAPFDTIEREETVLHEWKTARQSTPPRESLPSSSPTLGFLDNVYHGTVGFFSHEIPLSMLIATVVMASMLYFAWLFNINHYQELAEHTPSPPGKHFGPETVYVGRITGMKDCRWAKPDAQTVLGASVSLEREYTLSSGLMEITYLSGAKVILEGPCTFKVDSNAGGFLGRGKLTANISGQKSEKRGQRSENSSFIPHPSSFVVTTPTAVVTDLGTEFCVEVAENGDTTSHVFQGVIKVEIADGTTKKLTAGESITVSRVRETHQDSTAAETVRFTHPTTPPKFVRRMPKWMPIEVFSTGVGLEEGNADPNWQIVARGDSADFEPRPAVVTSITYGTFRVNAPARSQWISLSGDLPDLPSVNFTFRTTFELNNVSLETAVLQGRFIVDNHVDDIRLNGRSVPVPDHGYEKPFYYYHSFTIKDGFVAGTNVLEFEVSNASPDSRPTLKSPMILRVELFGSALADGEPAASRNKLKEKKKPQGENETGGTINPRLNGDVPGAAVR